MPEGVSNSMITHANKPFSMYELEQITLSCVQETVSAINLQNNHTIPSFLSEFVQQLEKSKKAVMSMNSKSQHAQVVVQPSTSKKTYGKCKVETNQKHGSTNNIPFKKSRMGKFCNHCATCGGAKYTHNTNECHKYDKNGKLNKNFKSKAQTFGIGKVTETTNANVMVPMMITIE